MPVDGLSIRRAELGDASALRDVFSCASTYGGTLQLPFPSTTVWEKRLADPWYDLTRLELEVFTDNARAIALYERFGFEREGILRQFAFRDGAYRDVYYMARLRR